MGPWIPAFLAATLVAQVPPSGSAAEDRLRKDVAFLASPALQGRGNGSPGLEQAAAHILREWKALGLEAEIQRFPFVARVVPEAHGALLTHGEAARPLVWGRDIEAIGYSGDADFRMKPLAFAGFGVQIPGGYDDLAGLDVKDRVVVIARTLPELNAFAHLSRSDRSLLARVKRLEIAKAAAVLVLEDGPVRPLQREEGPVRLDIPVLSLSASALGDACGNLQARLQAIRNTGKPASQDFIYAPWTTLTLKLRLRREEAQVPTVVAVIPGRDPQLRKEYIVLGAHLDHLGLGERHSLGGAEARGQVHPGADDNASGAALVVELGRELKEARPRRSILLMHFGGEEEGLLGSSHWIQHPTYPLESVKFMLNFDMVGRLDPAAPKLLMGGLGAPKSALEAAKKLAPEGFSITGDVGAAVGGSDHMSFSQAKIPTFFFFTGIHGEYHRPTDTADRINFAGLAKLAAYGRTLALDLADAGTVPAFDPGTAKIVMRGNGGPMRVAFGTLPDYADNPKGFRINGVSPGSTAEAMGLQAGDIIISFGGRPVKNIYDFMDALGAHKPGDTAVVRWLRGDQTMQAEATLKGRS